MDAFSPEYFRNYQQLSEAAANLILDRFSGRETIQIGVATGHSPLKAYQFVANELKSKPSLREKIQIFQLDEWLGVSSKNYHSCQNYIHQNIRGPWQIAIEKCFLLEGDSIDQQDQIRRMSQHLDQQPLDLCVLGLGANGHLALNEPGSLKDDSFRIVELSKISQSHSMLKGHVEKVKKGITIGLKEILEAKEILLIITGKNKKEVTRRFLSAKADPDVPASVLFGHPNWHCYIDENVLT